MCRGTLAEDDPDYFEGTDCYTRRFQLLAFWPLKVEEDLGAQSLFDLIADTLSRYNKPWDAVPFMVADNCSVNQYIGSREGGLPMVGCASHRFKLAVTDYLTSYKALQSKIHALMTKLRTIKGSAILRRVTDLSPLLQNDTRWSSTYAMVQWYTKLEPTLNSLSHEVLADFEGVTKALQHPTLTLSGVRRLFVSVTVTTHAQRALGCPCRGPYGDDLIVSRSTVRRRSRHSRGLYPEGLLNTGSKSYIRQDRTRGADVGVPRLEWDLDEGNEEVPRGGPLRGKRFKDR
ncbi:hypothetical protein L916_01921 [Phytophthora nicotianae]|uniref:Uncharacterized protein n=1 Tax=Phytophthora nicotianae TaxID=4792 RepID=W2JPY4_PHYNI|nr:hypothetical protein L916_01921 [Phytophthora nicotianae]